MRFLPPLNIQKEHVDFFIRKLETALKLIPTPSPI
jgi:acetylornithine/succinyldiaminopimelate/putrescine aminotransferase